MNKNHRIPYHYLNHLEQSLNVFQPHPPAVTKFFGDHVHLVRLTRDQLLLEAGQVCGHYYFICKGAVRGFIKEGRKDITTWISVENEMVTSISSLDLSRPAFENMQAIEDTDLLAMSNKDLNLLYDTFPSFNITGRLLLQQYYRDAEGRAYISRLRNAETKYRYFLSHYNHLSNRIQLKYIASFLGITLETLSRVRRKLSVQK
ncbi:MAG: Crp/Fnr family transcriptional regulator [Puia sp.]|nr:Crp/Fnr family transcriptional regulator [Puia sp.]